MKQFYLPTYWTWEFTTLILDRWGGSPYFLIKQPLKWMTSWPHNPPSLILDYSNWEYLGWSIANEIQLMQLTSVRGVVVPPACSSSMQRRDRPSPSRTVAVAAVAAAFKFLTAHAIHCAPTNTDYIHAGGFNTSLGICRATNHLSLFFF